MFQDFFSFFSGPVGDAGCWVLGGLVAVPAGECAREGTWPLLR